MNKEEIIIYLNKKKDESHKLHREYIKKDENMSRFYSVKYNTLCEILAYIEEN